MQRKLLTIILAPLPSTISLVVSPYILVDRRELSNIVAESVADAFSKRNSTLSSALWGCGINLKKKHQRQKYSSSNMFFESKIDRNKPNDDSKEDFLLNVLITSEIKRRYQMGKIFDIFFYH
jgi:hypothetical protein